MDTHLSPQIRVLMADDHPALRQGLSLLFQQQPSINLIGEATTGEETVRMAMIHKPDVILLDLVLPDIDPVTLTNRLREACPMSKILVFTGVEKGEMVYDVIDAGIDGYAVKSMDVQEVTQAIMQVAAGYSYLHPTITRMILHRAAHKEGKRPFSHTPQETLTRRQHQVLMLMASTSTNGDIAKRLAVSEETVRSHVKSILRKFGVSNRTQAVVEAVRRGIITI